MRGSTAYNIEHAALKSAASQPAHCYGLPNINKLNFLKEFMKQVGVVNVKICIHSTKCVT